MGAFDSKQGQLAHESILETIRRGGLKQFQLVSIPVGQVGFAQNGGNRGLFEVEGNALLLPASIFIPNQNVVAGTNPKGTDPNAVLHIAFNQYDNVWLPFAAANVGYPNFQGAALSFFRFWVFVSAAGAPNGVVHLLVLKGVNLYGAGYPQSGGGYQ